MRNIYDLPVDLPQPIDDGGCNHLTGLSLPSIELKATTSGTVNVADMSHKPCVLFIFPRAGSPLEPNTNQDLWDQTPGARGCTPQSCSFRDLFSEFKDLGYSVFGLSMQNSVVQKEITQRNELPFPILSDDNYLLTEALRLPTFVFKGERLIKRMALVIRDGKIQKVFYPVFPPDKNAADVLFWLRAN